MKRTRSGAVSVSSSSPSARVSGVSDFGAKNDDSHKDPVRKSVSSFEQLSSPRISGGSDFKKFERKF